MAIIRAITLEYMMSSPMNPSKKILSGLMKLKLWLKVVHRSTTASRHSFHWISFTRIYDCIRMRGPSFAQWTTAPWVSIRKEIWRPTFRDLIRDHLVSCRIWANSSLQANQPKYWTISKWRKKRALIGRDARNKNGKGLEHIIKGGELTQMNKFIEKVKNQKHVNTCLMCID